MLSSSAALEVAAVLGASCAGTAAAGGGGGSCAPAWSREGKPCPYGHQVWLPFVGFTLPFELSPLNLLACCYSILPFVAMCANVVLVVKRRRPRELLWILFVLSMNLVNEMLKSAFGKPRPGESCLKSCGMPSGHASYAIGLFVFVLLWDSVSRSVEDSELAQERKPRKGIHVALFALALLPIPWSRVQLGDHSRSQVVAGSFVGLLGALAWLLCLGPCCEAFLEKVLRRVRSELLHDAQSSIVAAASQREPVLDRSLLGPSTSSSAPAGGTEGHHHTELSKSESQGFWGVVQEEESWPDRVREDGAMPLHESSPAVFS